MLTLSNEDLKWMLESHEQIMVETAACKLKSDVALQAQS